MGFKNKRKKLDSHLIPLKTLFKSSCYIGSPNETTKETIEANLYGWIGVSMGMFFSLGPHI